MKINFMIDKLRCRLLGGVIFFAGPSWAQLDESSIPLRNQLEKAALASSAQPSWNHWLILFGIPALLALAAWVFVRHGQKLLPRQKSPISMKVLNHLPLGGKKYLSVVEVAGEHLVLGISENQITFIKSLSLLDEDFSKELSPQEVPPTIRASGEDEFVLAHVAELVKDKVQTLKPLNK